MENPRRMALEALIKMKMPPMWGEADGYSNIITDAAIKKAGDSLDTRDRALFCCLVAGVTERRISLDWYISKLSSRPIQKLDADVLNLLRLGLWQLIYADKIPEHAAVNETVNLAGKYSRGFVNAMMRSYLRQKDGLVLPQGFTAADLSVRYSVDKLQVSEYLNAFGTEKTVALLEASFSAPKMTLRTNTLRITRDKLAARLASEGFETENCSSSPWGLKITAGDGLPASLGEGLCFVQDEASQLCALVLDAKPGERVLDACACPGSKSFGAALTMENRGEILACDLHSSKLPLVKKTAEKLGITIIETAERDSSVPDESKNESFDRIICDVPCSGFGVMAKKPEIRYKSLKEAKKLPALQLRILEASAAMLKKGGTLVYSTCTVLPCENREVVESFLEKHKEFEALPFTAGEYTAEDGRLQLLPDGNTDGFFIAKLHRLS